MDIRTVNIGCQLLTEGEWYLFKIIKRISLDDNESFFVLADKMNYKILLPANYYADYGLKVGQNIKCRVDKINCNGQIFLEPEHPVYAENEKYFFDVIEAGRRKNIIDQDELFFVVKDAFSNKWMVTSTDLDNQNLINSEKIECCVERIKKGKLFLKLVNESDEKKRLKIGEEYDFKVIDERLNPDDGFMYYILQGPDGAKHLLKKKYYPHYGIKIGNVIRCRVVKFNSEGYFFLEPENPKYIIGEVYEFPVKRFEEIVYSDGIKQKVIVLEDKFSEEVNVFIDDYEFEKYKDKKSVNAYIDNIRKSRLELKLI